jgi:hypothetical protein
MLKVRTLSALTAALTLVLLAAPARAAEADKLLPDDTTLIVSVNVKQVLDSPLGKQVLVPALQQGLKQHAQVTQSLTALGLDPLKDFDTLTLATSGVTSTDAETEAGKLTAIVHGNFDLTKVHATGDALIKQKKLEMNMEGQTRIYENKTEKQTAYFAFLDKSSLVAAGNKANVLHAVTSSGKAPKLSKEMTALLGKIDGKQPVWFAALASEEVKKGLAQLPQTSDVADKINGFSGVVAVDKEIKLGMAIHTADTKSATTVSQLLDDGLNFVKPLVKGNDVANQLGKDNALALANLVDSIKVGASKDAATADLKITDEAIQKLMKAMPQ